MQENLDSLDRRILRLLQRDGRLTNRELAAKVNLSASQCSRRRSRLEAAGTVRGYTAKLDPEHLGLGLTVFINVTLATHNRDNAKNFAELCRSTPSILEAHALSGEMDYLLKVVASDLKDLSALVNDKLLPHDSVQTLKSAIVLETIKDDEELPV